MSPQAVRSSPSRPRVWPSGLPPRTYGLLIALAILLVLLGRLLLPLAILLAVGVGAVLWLAPEVAYWVDDALWLHRVPLVGDDHRQMALASFAYLALASVLGNVALGGVGEISRQPATPTPAATLPVVIAAPLATPTALSTATPLPTSAATPTVDSSTREDLALATSLVRLEPRAAQIEPTAPPARPTFTLATTRPATFQPSAVVASTIATLATAGSASPTAISTSSAEAQHATSDLGAEITGMTNAVNPGGRASLQARAAPGASCELSIQYAGGSGSAPGALKAGDDGVCAWSWVVPPGTASGPARATLQVKSGGKTSTRQATINVG